MEKPIDVCLILEEIAHALPSQGAIKDFIHHNTLHAFQEKEFFEAVWQASNVYKARPLMALGWYQEAYATGKITRRALERATLERKGPPVEELLTSSFDGEVPPRQSKEFLGTWTQRLGFPIRTVCDPLMVRLAAHFLDQGIAIWRMPYASYGFFDAIRRLVQDTPLIRLLPSQSSWILDTLDQEPIEVIQRCLKRLVSPSDTAIRRYLWETAFALRGWSGMIHVLENKPEQLLSRRHISLNEWVAVDLITQVAVLEKHLGATFLPLPEPSNAPISPRVDTAVAEHASIWQVALEYSTYDDVVLALSHAQKSTGAPQANAPRAQMYFCIDDRECSIRRYVELLAPNVQTFGTAGFFQMDILYQGLHEHTPVKLCPVPLSPKHLIRELGESGAAGPRRKDRLETYSYLERGNNTFIRGWLLSQTLGITSAIRLALNLFRPSWSAAVASSLSQIQVERPMKIFRTSQDEKSEQGLWLGYTYEEAAQRVSNLLKGSGLVNNFARLIVMVAHGSSSVNNPHFSAYDCGACSGRPGSPNARLFCAIANDPRVRIILREAHGIDIPHGTYFQAALHDTTRDEVKGFDLDQIPTSHQSDVQEMFHLLERALKLNSKERSRRFESVPLYATPERTHEEVKKRSISIFEPRPELNHATNCLAIVGRRELTKSVFLDRRAFLNSYDYRLDPQGDILAAILSAVIPVCGGINLEYFFSRVDPDVYGAGTKLSHNVMALVAVTHGTEGDLQTGLPIQMTEVHDPVRLLIIVDAPPELAKKALVKHPSNLAWVEKEWVHYAAIDPNTGHAFMLKRGGWQSYDMPGGAPEACPSLVSYIQTSRENLKVVQIQGL